VNKLARISAIAVTGLLFSLLSLGNGVIGESVPSRSFEFHYTIHVAAAPAGSHELRLWAPLPYEDSHQSISDLRIEAPVSHEIRRESEYSDRYAYFSFDAAHLKESSDIKVVFRAKRFENQVSLQPVAGMPAQSMAVAHFLEPDRLVPVDGHYDHDGPDWGRGDAVWACNSKHGNCTDFHSLFIAMARAAGIPARFEIGFPLPGNAHEGAISSYHCWAEFYIDRVGWVPIDASEAWKNPPKKDYFFGATDPNRVMFSLGRDIRLNPPQSAEPLNYFVYPYAELDGKPYTNFTKEISFRDDTTTAATASATR
jgi:transglutaminase-like putative cysteine protease